MKKRILITVVLTLLLMITAGGCSKNTKEEAENKAGEQLQTNVGGQKGKGSQRLSVYVSIYPMYDFVRNIGKDKINVKQIVPPGSEPHDWELTAKIMVEMEKADIFIYNGVGIEPWADKLKKSIKNSGLIVVDASKGIELLRSGSHDDEDEQGQGGNEHSLGLYDPHVWLDPLNAVKQAENIKDALAKADEDNKAFYEENYKEFSNKLMDLDKKYKEQITGLKRKEIVVAHSAFGYLAKRYGLEQIAVRGVAPQEEPTPAKMAEIANLLKSRDIKYVFFETLTNPRLSEVLAREVGAKTAVLNPLGGITEEDLKAGKDYITIMKENLEVLKQALGE